MHRDIYFVLISTLNWGQDGCCIYLSLCIRIFTIYTLILIPGMKECNYQLPNIQGFQWGRCSRNSAKPICFIESRTLKKLKRTKFPTQRCNYNVYTCIFILISFNYAFVTAKLSEHVSITWAPSEVSLLSQILKHDPYLLLTIKLHLAICATHRSAQFC